jgi:hypothetical protein
MGLIVPFPIKKLFKQLKQDDDKKLDWTSFFILLKFCLTY